MLDATLAIHSQRKIVWRSGLQVERAGAASAVVTLPALYTPRVLVEAFYFSQAVTGMASWRTALSGFAAAATQPTAMVAWALTPGSGSRTTAFRALRAAAFW